MKIVGALREAPLREVIFVVMTDIAATHRSPKAVVQMGKHPNVIYPSPDLQIRLPRDNIS